jgi:hypothetical protein
MRYLFADLREMVMKVNEIANIGCSIKIRISDDVRYAIIIPFDYF